MKRLIYVFGDQLSHNLPSLEGIDPNHDIILMTEVQSEVASVKHHKKKLVLILSAMRHFAKELADKGYNVRYVTLDDPKNTGSFSAELDRAIVDEQPDHVIVTEPSEYRVLQEVKAWAKAMPIPVDIRPDTRFLATPQEFAQWAQGRKQLRMEYFYREMRKKHDVLIEAGGPIGGQWNYDAENRKPPKSRLLVPRPTQFQPDEITQDVIIIVDTLCHDHWGKTTGFALAVTSKEAQHVLDEFIAHRLPNFGTYQDAMVSNQPWMYHAHVGFYLNCGLLDPMVCIRAAERAYHQGHAPLNAVEGFIRQILGWREYVRGLYWLKMPDYKSQNALDAQRKLPEFFWTAQTDMNCLKICIQDTHDNAYAHHIQRLMVLGNFALLAGIHPDEINQWYLIVYADAFEWVELPNVSGMVLYADGGLLASKPYAASGAYINRMSDYCKSCRYKVTQKTGPEACPFNYLYWDFLDRLKDQLAPNPRMAMMYKNLNRIDQDTHAAIKASAAAFLESLD